MGRRSPHRRSRSGLWFAAFTVVSLLMLLASGTDQARTLQAASASVLTPVRGAVSGVAEGIGGIFGTVAEIDELRRDNATLRERLAAAEERLVALEEAARENQELRELLGIREQLEFDLLPVEIVARDPGNFTREIGIGAGTEDGLTVGMVVVGGAEGAPAVVGTISEVAADHARVQLIVDTRSSIIALDQETRALGVVEGRLGGQLVLSDVPVTEDLGVGDTVVSAGLQVSETVGSRFPGGLLIGRIIAVEPDANGLTQTAFVRPAVDFTRLQHLLVITGPEAS